MRLLRQLALTLSAAAILPAVASAQSQLTFAASQPAAFNNGSYLVGPFGGSLATTPGQSTSLTIFCVDILNTVGFGDTFGVNVTSLANGADLSNTRHPSMLTQYREAAWISSYFSVAPQNMWGSMQYAMWGLLNPSSAPADATSPSIIALANHAASQNFHAFTYGGMSFAEFNYSRYSVLTDVRSAAVGDDSFKQEFITGTSLPVTTSTPEPATFVLVGAGLFVTAGFARRRARSA